MSRDWSVRFRIAALPVLLSLVVLFATRPPSASSGLLALISLLLLLIDLVSLLRGRSRDVLLVVTSIIFGLFSIEVAAERLAPGPVLKASYSLSLPQPVIGWGPKRAGQFYARKIDPRSGAAIYDVHYTIDSNLLRETLSCATCTTIAFFGDSFTFGEGLNDADTLPQMLSDDFGRRLRVINLGFPGYGPQQILREMETGRFDKVIGPRPKLFVFLTAPWHAPRAACKGGWMLRAPRYALADGKVAYKGPCYAGANLWLRQWLEQTTIYRSLIEPDLDEITNEDIELYIRILLAAVDLAKKKYGVPTLIAYIRASANYLHKTDFNDEKIMARLRSGGANVLDVSLLKEEAAGAKVVIPGDGHPTAYANKLRASIIQDYIDRHLAAAP